MYVYKLLINKNMNKDHSNKNAYNHFLTIAEKSDSRNIEVVGRMLTRNRNSPRIGHLQEEDSVIQDE